MEPALLGSKSIEPSDLCKRVALNVQPPVLTIRVDVVGVFDAHLLAFVPSPLRFVLQKLLTSNYRDMCSPLTLVVELNAKTSLNFCGIIARNLVITLK